VRARKDGDYFIPLGMKGKQKLSDFYIDKKISLMEKSSVPVVLSGMQVVWVAGWRLDNRFKIQKGCKNVFLIKLETIDF